MADTNPTPENNPPAENIAPAEKVRSFPQTPGVYLMKDAAGRVIYVGKAKNLRSRAGSYFLKAAAEDPRTAELVVEIRDIDYLDAESEVDALLVEARLIKDLQPKHNKRQRDGKSFPYLEIHVREEYPRVRITREPKSRGTKLYGPFANPWGLRGAMQVLQRIFQFRTCSLDITTADPRWRWFRPCLLASIRQCTAPCNLRISKEDYRRDVHRLQKFLEGKKKALQEEMRDEMKTAAGRLQFEEAARLRDEIHLLETLDQRGEIDTHAQPEVFPIDPKKGLAGLQRVLRLPTPPRIIEGIDIAHTSGQETVGSLVQFIDGLPARPGYRRYRIRSVEGINDVASIGEVVARRFRRKDSRDNRLDNAAEDLPVIDVREDAPIQADDSMDGATTNEARSTDRPDPDILLIDGGPAQLNAAVAALARVTSRPPVVISLAKREELVFVTGREKPLRLSRRSYALRLLQYVRDEAHRFAQHYHHILRRRSTLGE